MGRTLTNLEIAREEARWIAVAKPAGLLTIPGRGEAAGQATLRQAVEEHLGGKAYVVHRLDQAAGGLVLFAKDARAHRHLCRQFEGRSVEKAYLAVVSGNVERDGTVEAPIRGFGSGRTAVDPRGKPSATRYRVLERWPEAALLEVRPLTGRRHQIRVHLYSIGHPILGDALYGPGKGADAPRLMLHAWKLFFKDPDGKEVRLECGPPLDFTETADALRGDAKTPRVW